MNALGVYMDCQILRVRQQLLTQPLQTFTKRDQANPRNVLRPVNPDGKPIRQRHPFCISCRVRPAMDGVRRCGQCRVQHGSYVRAVTHNKLPRSERVGMPEKTSADQGRVGGVLTVASASQPSLFQEQGV